MILKLEIYNFRRKLNSSMTNPLYYPIINQLKDPHDPKCIIWNKLLIPSHEKLSQIETPIDNHLYNIPV